MSSGSPREAPRRAQAELFDKAGEGRISEMIVDQIRQLMRQGQLRPGDRLPAERDLCERFGVSRDTAREVLRMLESSGLIEIRGAARRGAFVTVPTSEHVLDWLADMLSLSALTAADVTEIGLILEVGIVPLVCARATEEDLTDLDQICRRSRHEIRRGEHATGLSAEFHARVAAATHNPTLGKMAEFGFGSILMSLELANAATPEAGVPAIEEHEWFTDAVRKRDPALATKIMREHLGRITGPQQPFHG
jgi:GntR family transcriptional repressor for pyruvate dehydrogenase complex